MSVLWTNHIKVKNVFHSVFNIYEYAVQYSGVLNDHPRINGYELILFW